MNKLTSFLVSLIFLTSYVNCIQEHKIIIIGAGPSGIAAASKLLENGIEDILVLEAEPRLGGRVNTVNFDGRKVDMGAEWCHGEKNNIVYETLEEKKLLDLLERDEMPEQYYLSSRQNISDEFSKELFDTISEAYFEDEEADPLGSMGSVVEKRYNKVVATRYGHDSEKRKIFTWALDFLRHLVMSMEGTFSWYDSAFATEYEECGGYTNLGWKNNGYGKFLDVLTKKYPNPKDQLPIDDKIIVNKEVTKITITNNDVDILCSDNSTYKARHAIFTPSLGVLKEKAKSLFVPGLHTDKILAIERIGFGAVAKVFLKYETRWWGNSSGFNFIWTEADRLASKEKFPKGPTNTNGESWIVEIFNIMAMSNSNIVLIFLSGEMVPAIEKMDEKTLIDGVQYTLDKFVGHLFDIPSPQKILRSNWYANPHFRGTYSFGTVNSTGDDIRNLLAPVTKANGEPILQFAGEATSPTHHSTVHGAVESGFREANRLIKLYNKTGRQAAN